MREKTVFEMGHRYIPNRPGIEGRVTVEIDWDKLPLGSAMMSKSGKAVLGSGAIVIRYYPDNPPAKVKKEHKSGEPYATRRWKRYSLYRADEVGLDATGGPWVCVCEEHKTVLNCKTKALALKHLSKGQWCEECVQRATFNQYQSMLSR